LPFSWRFFARPVVCALALQACLPRVLVTPAQPESEPPRAAFFDTKPAPDPVRGDPGSEQELALINAGLSSTLRGDGRLAALAREIAGLVDANAQDFDLAWLEPMARVHGLANPTLQLSIGTRSTIEGAHEDLLNRSVPIAKQYEATHFGASAVNRGAYWALVIVLDRRPYEMAPVPTSLAEPGDVTVDVQVAESQKDPSLTVQSPDGEVHTVARGHGRDLKHLLHLEKGLWRIEIVATGAHGPLPLANFLLPVGVALPVERPEAAAKSPAGWASTDPADFVTALNGILDDERRSHQLPAVTRDEHLDAVALGHSSDMRDHAFFGHISPTTGGPGDRIKRAGVPAWTVRENIARGYSPEEVHRGLMSSPVHREAILAGDVDKLGLGVAALSEGNHTAFYVTELFARTPRPISNTEAVRTLLQRMNDERARKGFPAIQATDGLCRDAAVAALRFFREPALDQNDLGGQTLHDAHPPAGTTSMTCGVYAGREPAALDIPAEWLDPKFRWMGVGVAQGNHPRTGPAGIVVVVVLAQ
jgi:uncharacterized protein YkwD